MNSPHQKKQNKDVLSELLPQAISVLKKAIIAPLFSDNLFHKYANEKPPLRSELFTHQQMEHYARRLAAKHILTKGEPSEKMLKRLGENESLLVEIHHLLSETVKSNVPIAPAGEWLLDNFYLIEEHIYTGKKHLPKGYSKGLPQLANGASEGMPRVYDIIVELISHSDGRVDFESLSGFINAYQSVTILQLGELWAIPIMLRLALIENLRRLSTELALDILHKNLADFWADQMLETLDHDPKNLVVVIADMARSKPPIEGAFVAELTRKLQGRGAALSLPLSWIEQFVSDTALTSAEMVHLENQKQAAQQVSISNSIGSLRFLNNTNWRRFVEQESIVEKILNEDVDGLYGRMDFYTRDHYRHVIEKISKYSDQSEVEVARIAIEQAKQYRGDVRKQHVGYHLIDAGAGTVEKLAKVKLPFPDQLKRSFASTPLFYYLFGIGFLTALFCCIFTANLHEQLKQWQFALLLLACATAASQPAITFINWLSTLLTDPDPLPRMDFSTGIPQNQRTLVVIPTMLLHTDGVDALTESLEVRFVANRDDHLHFALLTDFKDAATQSLPGEEALIQYAKNKIIELNKKYGQPEPVIFMLFHRPRKWNAKENVWMGHERKRGKLEELNALLRGNGDDYFSLIVGQKAVFPEIKYVITLDTDTQLPREAAWKMTATMAHPLNKAGYSTSKRRITQGYSILQPRVSNSLPGPSGSFYARIHGNEPGIDPYTRMISDVYQDLFAEGSFIGKGIYEIDSFTASLEGRLPENRILSHDLVEGCYARSGFLSDVQLYEHYPPGYYADMQRRHRWIRGDWQILRWLFPLVPAPDKQYKKNPLSILSRWKIFDNIRRSLVPGSMILLLMYGWLVSNSTFWTIAVISMLILPSFIKLVWEICNKPKDISFRPHLLFTVNAARDQFFNHALDLVFLPYEAYINTDAIFRTAWRIFISKRNLLQWTPFGAMHNIPKTLFRHYKAMWVAPAFATAVLLYLLQQKVSPVVVNLPLLMAWMLSPAIAYLISLPRRPKQFSLTAAQQFFLQKLSRRTWAFFEKFVDHENNWLPPDNYQEKPGPKIAHRTSPTNIGLSLLANLTAFDFGYISMGRLIDRSARTLNTVTLLEKYQGHLFNWYDTITLACLMPRYISTVDSGNFVGHLITLKQGLLGLKETKIFSNVFFEGLQHTIGILLETNEKNIRWQAIKEEVEAAQASPPQTLQEALTVIEKIKESYAGIIKQINVNDKETDIDEQEWIARLGVQLNDAATDICTLAPWLLLYAPSPKLQAVVSYIDHIPTLAQLCTIQIEALPRVKSHYEPHNSAEENDWLDTYVSCVIQSSKQAKERSLIIDNLADQCDEFSNVAYDFLYSRTQHLLSIGYNVEEHRRDSGFYDLLASEARLGNFVAIAQGKLPQESWFALGRQLTGAGSLPTLLSWSGSMFEYLMPVLVMPSYDNTLLDETHKAIVQKQIDYGNKKNVPWGISESGYNMVDANLNYQYKAFGVPGTGLKRGLGEELVISPYSTIMALMVSPKEACDNLAVMSKKGFNGNYGFYEAIDYTPSRLPRGQEHVIIRSFMVHHQGMSFLSLSHLLLNQPMQKRFMSEVQFQATLLLLQERIPRISAQIAPHKHIDDAGAMTKDDSAADIRVINTPQTNTPVVQLLSNGRYFVMVTHAGGGYSRWKDIAVTRWREDSTCDNWGSFCFIRDMESNEYWSSAYQPALQNGDHYEAVFSQGRAEFRRRDFAIESHTEIVVSPEDDVELRRLHLTNRSRKKRIIEVTSYAEVVLAPVAADNAHPAFSNLFIQTALLEDLNAIICTRRPRSQHEQPPSMFHLMKVYKAEVQHVAYETDRAKFTGRGNTLHGPLAMQPGQTLSSSQGSVLDPIVSIQYRIEIEPQKTAVVDMITGIAETKEKCNEMIDKYQDKFLVDRGFELSWTHSQVILRQINASETDAQLYARLASAVIYTDQEMRGAPDFISRNNRGQSSLWSHSISGDVPIVLVKIENAGNIELVRQMIQAHAYWHLKGIVVDLVIWNEDHGGYRHTLQNQIMSLVAPLVGAQIKEQPGGVFIRSADQLSNEDRVLFETVARLVLSDKFGSLEEQINRTVKIKNVIPYFTPLKFYPSIFTSVSLPENLQCFNGTGGFSADGKEYVMMTSPEKVTPAPWCNVIANPEFGTIISESGQAYTWMENAHEFRLTPWNNNPVNDLEGECYYLRDEENGKFWSPSPLPVRGKSPYITRHGFGYSVFEHSEDGIHSEMTVFVDMETGVKFTILKVQNRSQRQRKLSVTGYVEWVLGEFRSKTQMHVVTFTNEDTGTIFARNAYNTEFAEHVAFFDADGIIKSFTCDRKEFLGRNGSNRNPAAMNKVKLSGKSGPALDPCAALQVVFDLAQEESHEVIFKLGAAHSHHDALSIIEQFKTHENVYHALDKIRQFWQHTLTTVQIQTPDSALNIMANGWLNYQTLAARIWGRSGFYQSGGAFGFRDQLQDILSLMFAKPDIGRKQILLNASRQFKEGDVQHWWHPPTGRGVRTTCSDDFLWLPYVTTRYVEHTGDAGILNEPISFLEGRMLNEGEDSYYDLPVTSTRLDSLYAHCVKSIQHALRFGEHGLPLMGSGDWNDGMDKVGHEGKGESVWLAFFLYDTLKRFSVIAASRNDSAFEKKCLVQAALLRKNIETHAWDGEWYRRAYFDDGTPLGSSQNPEASIDSIAQSWSVLSKAGNTERVQKAMQSAANHLVRKDAGLIQLLNPPFDSSALNPGYIKGYVPGVRENGGQYTHAAIWFVMALMELKQKQKGWELLQMINPVNRGNSAEAIAKYKVEPYVMAADVYVEPLHLGRGGWTWYTGSAGWMYQLIIESFLGLKQKGEQLHFDPSTPPSWSSFDIRYKYMDTVYNISIRTSGAGEHSITVQVDGNISENHFLPLQNDGGEHTVEVAIASL